MLTDFVANTGVVSVRLLAIFGVAPIAPFARMPWLIRLMLIVALAALMASAIPATVSPKTLMTVPVLGAEFALGMVIAFGFHAAQAGVDMVGRLMDSQVGINAAGVLDPTTAVPTSLFANLFMLMMCLLLISLNAHHALLLAFSQVLILVPPGQVSFALITPAVLTLLSAQIVLAFMTLLPVLLALWLSDVAFAFMARSMPQANIYFLALPIKLCVGIFMLIATLPLLLQRLPLLFEQGLNFSFLQANLS